jgi:hypothetical protein
VFKRPQKKTRDNAHLRGLTHVTPANQLILKNKRPQQIASIAETCQFTPPRFKTLCDDLFYALLNHTQQLPDTTNSYFSSPGGAFDHALSRTRAASELFQSFLLKDPNTPLSDTQQLWWYALFSAGLLRGIGKLPLDYVVTLYNQQEHLIKTWEPLREPLTNTGYAYQFETVNNTRDESFRQRLNIILAQQLMPEEGFTWLTQNFDVFEVWLALLQEDTASAGSLGLILDRADAIAIQEDLLDLLPDIQYPKQSGIRAHSFIDSPDAASNREQLMGAAFMKWLLENLESAKLTFNQNPLLSVAGGTIIGAGAFALFVRESPMFKNELAVMNSLKALGLCDETPGATDGKSVLLKGSLALPATFQQKTIKDSRPTETNAIDAQNPGTRQQLSSDGQWQAIAKEEPPAPTPKSHHR